MYQINKLTLWVILMAVTLAIAQPPTLLLPPNDSIIFNQYPFFDWEDVSGATSYRLQVADVPNFVTMLLDTTVENSQCTSEISLAQSDTLCIYYWRVFVEVPEGETSDVWTFGLLNKGPDLISPEPNAELNDETPTFLWYHQPGSQKYSIVVWGEVSPVVDDTITDTTYTCLVSLTNGSYSWDVKACDCMNNWSPPSTRSFSIADNIPPEVPTLVSPDSGSTINHNPTFSWNPVDEAVLYNLIVESETKTEIININTTGTAFTPVPNLSQGTYTWKVKAKDINNNWSNFSNPWLITIIYETPGWTQKRSIPTQVSNKYVKDGGALVATGNCLYAFRGNKSNEFYQYLPLADSWVFKESIPFTYKPNSTTLNKKRVGKGASLAYDPRRNKIYATKGNGTNEIWQYDITNNYWELLTYAPSKRGLKAGTAIAVGIESGGATGDFLYLLAGGQKLTDTCMFRYNLHFKFWQNLSNQTNLRKPFKAGSAMCIDDTILYVIQGGDKPNHFRRYLISRASFILIAENETLTTYDSVWNKTKWQVKKLYVKDGADIVSANGALYLIKGGNTNTFYQYTPETGWLQLVRDTIARINGLGVKTGANLAYFDSKVYLLKGNNTQEFWSYLPSTKLIRPTITSSAMTKKTTATNWFNFKVMPNPFEKMTTIRYTVATAGNVTIKLYNASGRLIETLVNEHLAAGNYTLTVSAEKLAKGIYFVKCENEGNSAQVKLIVQ